ncbi:MAG: hypothetical protein A2W91_04150 [Bacteroidetes bacterium GWF2_38_335]|nr:MAG: hypothetical protein A2W91_04150 [Bacteroidetes bacterium GWF2_38_335]OFY79143.1 MAG: hypothetical protein A2281_03485 [Bacteroidetes bacterium RIFOXYA12_FULL_38_20]HBS88770.1 hypothetical protein [Bacteroidales bacterium]
MKINLLLFSMIISSAIFAQYPPAAGQPGSDAVHRDSSAICGWAIDCSVIAGPVDISVPESGFPDFGVPADATGKAGDGKVVSLGDGGTAVVSFAQPLANGPGPDFAIFENGFQSAFAPYNYFLELAYVEVSSDGINYVKFPCYSNTPLEEQITSYGQLDPTSIWGLAGKYVLNYGTPFDLELLVGHSEINIDSITSIRITDVVGSINPEYARYDSDGRIINDPWPTAMYSSGFDLDAVGVINFRSSDINELTNQSFSLYPNPSACSGQVYIKGNFSVEHLVVTDLAGRSILDNSSHENRFSTSQMKAGIYIVIVNPEKENARQKLIIR